MHALGRLGASIPRAQPRVRFEMPPETQAPVDEEAVAAAVASQGAVHHPIHFGFMATVGVGLALLLYFVLTNVGQLLGWIAAALFIALGLDPVVRWLESKGLPRPAGVVAVVLALAGLLAAFFSTLIPTIVNQTTQIVANGPRYADEFLNSQLFQSIDQQFQVRTRVEDEVAKFFDNSEAITGIFGGVLGVGSAVLQGAFGALIVLVLTLYFLASLPALKIWAYRLAPKSKRQRVQALAEEITGSVGSYVIGQACVALINATVAFIAMSIAGVPFSVLLAFLVALLAFIPLVGGMIAGIMVSLVALTVGWQTAALFAIIYFAYLQFEAYFVSPRIMQRAVAVPGAVAVIAVIAGGSLMGVLGALMAIPAAAAVMLLLKEVVIVRQDRN
nr:AI-2E family transporter [Arthrobacter crystallopoietes]